MGLASLLVALLVLCVVIWAVRTLLAAFSIGDPLASVVYVVIVLTVVLWIASSLGHNSPILHL